MHNLGYVPQYTCHTVRSDVGLVHVCNDGVCVVGFLSPVPPNCHDSVSDEQGAWQTWGLRDLEHVVRPTDGLPLHHQGWDGEVAAGVI